MSEPSRGAQDGPPPDQPVDQARLDDRALPPRQPEPTGASLTPDADAKTFSFEHTFSFGKQLPLDAVPPEVLERLRSGGSPSAGELEALRSALGEPGAVVAQGPVRKFTWTWGGTSDPSDSGAAPKPATYYEALTGKPDPMRDFFITARRILNIGTWIIALGIPIGIVALAIATRQSFETVVFMGIAGAIVGMMFKTTFPKTPFG